MTAIGKGFGCRPEHERSIRYKAGVRKPPKNEPAGRLTLPRERPALPATREEALSLAARGNPNVVSAVFALDCLRRRPGAIAVAETP
jgi:hypothetical protein